MTSRITPPPRPITTAKTATPRMSKSLRSSCPAVPKTPPCMPPNATAARSIQSGPWAGSAIGPQARGSLVERADEPQRLARAVLALERRRALGLPVGAGQREDGHDEADQEVLPERAHAGAGAQRGARRSWIGRCTIAAPR